MGQLWAARHGVFGTLKNTFSLYSIYIYPQILYYRGVFTTFRSLVSQSSGRTLIYGNILNAGSAPFFSSSCLDFFSFSIDKRRVRSDILNS